MYICQDILVIKRVIKHLDVRGAVAVVLISCAVSGPLFSHVKSRFSHDTTQMIEPIFFTDEAGHSGKSKCG